MAKKASQQAAKQLTDTPRETNYNLLAWIIIAITGMVYSGCLNNAILNFDDLEYYNMYPEVINLSLASVKKIFTSYYLIMYQPLPVLTFAINYATTGMDPVPIHLMNVVMHLINIWLVFKFISELTEKKNIALIVAFLFALHPMNVEAVSWMSARSSSMYVLFYLLALRSYVRYHKTNFQTKHLIIAALYFIVSLFSKAQAVTLPVLLFAIDYYYSRKLNAKLVLEKIPFFALSIIFGLITVMDSDTQGNLKDGMLISYNAIDLFFMVCYSFAFYFVKLILPANLCGIYVYPPKTGGSLPWEYYASPVLLLAILFLLYRFRKNRAVIFGAALFFITISINIQLIPSRLFITTDRYAYFPYIGLFFIIGYIYNQLQQNEALAKKYLQTFGIVLVAAGLVYCYAIWERNKTWNNDYVFLTDIIEKNEPVPYISRAYGNRGNYFLNNGMINEALADFTSALKVKPDDGQSYYNRAITYVKVSRWQEALADLDSSIKYNPKFALSYSNMAFIRYNLKDYNGALEAANKCITIKPDLPEVYNIRAAVYFSINNLPAAEKDLDKALSLKKDFSDAYKNRGILYMNTNRKAQACSDFQNAKLYGDQTVDGLINTTCR
ncbi:MAG: tetratricopeptide repeat protein [Chitinophagales bacterium]|nr:tetratricopeptide repeat protein [Chitinophagales bacterium]